MGRPLFHDSPATSSLSNHPRHQRVCSLQGVKNTIPPARTNQGTRHLHRAPWMTWPGVDTLDAYLK